MLGVCGCVFVGGCVWVWVRAWCVWVWLRACARVGVFAARFDQYLLNFFSRNSSYALHTRPSTHTYTHTHTDTHTHTAGGQADDEAIAGVGEDMPEEYQGDDNEPQEDEHKDIRYVKNGDVIKVCVCVGGGGGGGGGGEWAKSN